MSRAADLSPVKTLALARLLAAGDEGETEKTLSKDLTPLVKHRWEGRVWTDRLNAVLNDLESAGLLRQIVKGKTSRLALTDAGTRRALDAFGIGERPAKLTWGTIKGSLPALALGLPGLARPNLQVEILRSHYDLALGDGKPSKTRATDALAAKLLGLESGQKFTADNILRKLLRDAGIETPPGKKPNPKLIGEALFHRELGDSSAKKPLDMLATRSVGARQNTAAELAAAVVRSWVDRAETTTEIEPPAEFDLPDFARRVAEAARSSLSGWFGDAKVFISHVRPAFPAMDDADFRTHLIEAHRAGLLELGRADLVDAMDPADVRESAIPYLNAVYHFVRTEGPGR